MMLRTRSHLSNGGISWAKCCVMTGLSEKSELRAVVGQVCEGVTDGGLV